MGGNDKKCTVTYRAYAKLMLHAAKHGNAMVVGFLTGTSNDDGTEFTVDNVFPLFHTAPLPAMLEGAAALVDAHLSSEAEGEEGGKPASSIVGVYFAPGDSVAPDANDSSGGAVSALTAAAGRLGIPGAVSAIADTVRATNGGKGCVLKVDCETLKDPRSTGLLFFTRSSSSSSGKWMLAGAGGKGGKGKKGAAAAAAAVEGKGVMIEGGSGTAAKRLNVALVGMRHGLVSDFEDHVGNAESDWFNFFLDEALEAAE